MKYLIIILLLSSCGQLYHYNKFIDKGGRLDQIETVVTITDTLQGADGKDSIVFRDVVIDCPDPIIQTRWKTRLKYKFDNRRFRDSLRFTKRMYSDSLKSAVKSLRIGSRVEKNKNNNYTKQIKAKWGIWKFLAGLVVGFVLALVAIKIKKKV